MGRKYIELYDCPHCKTETTHSVYDAGHERDSSNDFKQCMMCNAIDFGLTGVYSESWVDDVEVIENPEFDIKFPKFIILTYLAVAIFLILKAKNIL